MNILIVGKFYTEGFALHIAETLRTMGHVVRRLEPGVETGRLAGRLGHRIDQLRSLAHDISDGVPLIRQHRRRQLWRIVDDGPPLDVVIVCHDFLWPEEVAELKRRTRARIALWFPDAFVNFGRGYFMNAPYDGLFFKDPYIIHILSTALATPVYYLPECFNPAVHLVPDDSHQNTYACDVTTAGNQHSYRVAVLKHLRHFDVRLWGAPAPVWLDPGPVRSMHQGRPVFNEDKARAFRSAKIVLNSLHYGEVWGVNARTFEAAGAGAFQLVDWRPGISQLFTDGEELVTFRGMADMKQKIVEWLPRQNERLAIGAAASKRALAEHTYTHRLQLLLRTLAGEASGFPLPETGAADGFFPRS